MAGKRSPAKHRHFWRAGFWLRPALVLRYSAIAVIGGAAVLLAVPARISEARAMLAAAECGRGTGEDCLRRVPSRMDGPYHRRGPGDRWDVAPINSVEEPFERVAVSTAGSRRLDDGAFVDALIWRDEVVAVQTADGVLVETDEYGHRGWLSLLGWGSFVLAGGLVGVKVARLKRKASDGWWSTSAPSVPMIMPNPSSMVVGVLFFAAAPLVFTLAVGMSVAWSVGITLATATALTALIVWGLLRRRR